MNLSWKLAAVLEGDLPESTLDTYEAERKPHARALVKLAKLVGAAMTQGGRAGDVLRRVVAPRLHWVAGLRERLLDSETPPLSRGQLVVGPRRSLAGRLCPNAMLEDGTRLDDASHRGFLLVTTVEPTATQQRELALRGVRLVRPTAGSQLDAWLASGHATTALVRPDFTVMQSGKSLAAICGAAPRFSAA